MYRVSLASARDHFLLLGLRTKLVNRSRSHLAIASWALLVVAAAAAAAADAAAAAAAAQLLGL